MKMNSPKNSVLPVSNESGLSSISASIDSDQKSSYLEHQNDLTKSLFINSCRGNALIHDDDIYSYKSKVEFKTPNVSKLFVNLSKTDSIRISNPNSLTHIFEDLANLESNENNHMPFVKSSSADNTHIDSKLNIQDNLEYMLFESITEADAWRPKRNSKKVRSSTLQSEYVSSSIDNYKGDKNVNDIVSYIEGSQSNSSKALKSPMTLNIVSKSNHSEQSFTPNDSGIYSERSSPISAKIKKTQNNDVDSGIQSSDFVSFENSEEDYKLIKQSEFQEVKSKNKKKQKKPLSNVNVKVPSENTKVKPTNPRRRNNKIPQKQNCKLTSDIEILDSIESFQSFMQEQFNLFQKLSK